MEKTVGDKISRPNGQGAAPPNGASGSTVTGGQPRTPLEQNIVDYASTNLNASVSGIAFVFGQPKQIVAELLGYDA